MSKIGKKNIIIPKDSSIKIEGADLTISGPKGTKKLTINDKIFSSKLKESSFQLQPLEKKLDKTKKYKARIVSSLKNGHMVFGEFDIKGKSKKTILLTSYICHPSMANNELSGILTICDLMKSLKIEEIYYISKKINLFLKQN